MTHSPTPPKITCSCCFTAWDTIMLVMHLWLQCFPSTLMLCGAHAGLRAHVLLMVLCASPVFPPCPQLAVTLD